MPDDKLSQSPPATSENLTRKHSVSLPGLHARLRNPIAVDNNADAMPNRIALLLDVSGSMSGRRIASLHEACQSFITACDFSDTAIALEPFGEEPDPPPSRLALTRFSPILLTRCMSLQASGTTPMAEAMQYAVYSWSLTRAVLVSDGQPDNEQAVYIQAENFHEAGVPCDCVHIGDFQGEACLRKVAEITGGQFIKFTDIDSFAKNFKYLTPAYYGQLTSGAVSVEQLGGKR